MLCREMQRLFAERAVALGPDLLKKKYVFQGGGAEGSDHFRSLSQSYRSLTFILVYGWDDRNYGSHFISRGRARSYAVPARRVEKDWPIAEAHCQSLLLRTIQHRFSNRSTHKVASPV